MTCQRSLGFASGRRPFTRRTIEFIRFRLCGALVFRLRLVETSTTEQQSSSPDAQVHLSTTGWATHKEEDDAVENRRVPDR